MWEKIVIVYIKPIFNVVSTLFSQVSWEVLSACVPSTIQASSLQDRLIVFYNLSATQKNYSQTVARWLALKETERLFKMTNKSKILYYLKLYSAILHISKWLFIIKNNVLLSPLFTALCSPKNPCRNLACGLLWLFEGCPFCTITHTDGNKINEKVI